MAFTDFFAILVPARGSSAQPAGVSGLPALFFVIRIPSLEHVQTRNPDNKKEHLAMFSYPCGLWAFTDSNRRPSACKADALNQLS